MTRKRIPTQITMLDVAKAAGVSTASVSRAINTPHKLSSSTRRRIETAIIATGYQIEQTSEDHSGSCLLIIAKHPHDSLQQQLIDELQNAATLKGLWLLVIYLHQQEEAALEHFFISPPTLYGIILFDCQLTEKLLAIKAIASLPKVTIGHSQQQQTPAIDIDHLTTAFNAVQYLRKTGRFRMAYIGCGEEHMAVRFHLQGMTQAHHRYRIALEQTYLHPQGEHHQQVIKITKKLLTLPMKPDAILCANDDIALTALYQLQQYQQQTAPISTNTVMLLSLMGSSLSRHRFPSISAMMYPCETICQQAMTYLTAKHEGKTPLPSIKLLGCLTLRGVISPTNVEHNELRQEND